MKRPRLILASLCSGLVALHSGAQAFTADNPYSEAITNMNLFRLKAPPDPASVQAPPPAVASVSMVGITTLMGGKRVMLRVPKAAKPPEPAREVSLILGENDPAEEGVQVLEIDVAAGSVKINNNGTIQTLDLKNNAPKSSGGGAIPVPGGGPRGPGAVPMSMPVPVPVPGTASAAPASAPGSVTAIGRPLRGQSAALPSSSSGLIGAGPSGIATPSSRPATPQLSAEQQMLLMELERERTKDDVTAGRRPPLPPTPFTPDGANGLPTRRPPSLPALPTKTQ